MNCHQCSQPLTQSRGRYCSTRCANLGKIIHRPRPCARCPRVLTRRQIGRRQRYCSNGCARAEQIETTPMQDALLAVLRVNRAWFMTVPDLAIWVYGHDDEAERDAVRALFASLRKRGFCFERRAATWMPRHETARAYRLISEPIAVQRRAA